MRYQPVKVNIGESQEKRLSSAIKKETGVSIKVVLAEPAETTTTTETLLLTDNQIQKIERAKLTGKSDINIKMSAIQVKANTRHEGGFLWALASRIAPAILTGVMSALASKATQKVMSSKKGRGLYLQKNGHCAKVKLVDGGGLYLAPHPRFHGGMGVFEGEGSKVKGDGLLLGENSPFKSVPLLNILL